MMNGGDDLFGDHGDGFPGVGGDGRSDRGDEGDNEGSGTTTLATIAVMGVFAFTGGLLVRSFFQKGGNKKKPTTYERKEAAADIITLGNDSRRARKRAFRRRRSIQLHQFEYAWAAQAHLRMAKVDFVEHNVRCVVADQSPRGTGNAATTTEEETFVAVELNGQASGCSVACVVNNWLRSSSASNDTTPRSFTATTAVFVISGDCVCTIPGTRTSPATCPVPCSRVSSTSSLRPPSTAC